MDHLRLIAAASFNSTTPDHCTTFHNPTTNNSDSPTTTNRKFATITTSSITYNPMIYLTANNLYLITATAFNPTPSITTITPD